MACLRLVFGCAIDVPGGAWGPSARCSTTNDTRARGGSRNASGSRYRGRTDGCRAGGPSSEVISFERADLRIIDAETWFAVRTLLRSVHRAYTSGPKNGRRRPRGRYLLSGLIVCDACGAPMNIAGSVVTYYRCSENRSKGLCPRKLTLREEVVRRAVVQFLRRAIRRPEVQAERERFASGADRARTACERRVLQAELDHVEQRLRNLVAALAEGGASEAISAAIRELEAEAEARHAALQRLSRAAYDVPVVPDHELVQILRDMGSRGSDVERDRQLLRYWLRNGEVRASPGTNGVRLLAAVAPRRLIVKNPYFVLAEAVPEEFSIVLDVEVAAGSSRFDTPT